MEKEHGHTRVGLYVQAMAKWLAVALVTGVCCGVVGPCSTSVWSGPQSCGSNIPGCCGVCRRRDW
ncbi:hypothetical protein [Oscillibacter sp.]|uniref:hypothetical protein n=1 Tax=Oscillibacter sp. TaxID=1945593 RepID=UPI00257A53CF|nr:hypothetical protein [Oscillibacter sp.]